MSTPAYDVQDLVKRYPGQPQPANDGITFRVEPGEIFGILGDNGAGKSTLVRQMAGLLRVTSGSIALFGRDVGRHVEAVALQVGYMPQDGRALNNLTVGEALYFTAHLRGRSRADARAERDRLLELWDIGALASTPTPRLSGGQKRLLQLAVAMAGGPPVLILDEPTNDLDPQRRQRVWSVLRQSNAEQGTTVIFITHDAVEAEKVIQRVAILRAGRLAAIGRPPALKRALGGSLRLELFFPPGAPPTLPSELQPQTLEPGRWLVLVSHSQAAEVIARLDQMQVDDIRLHTATLEDLYLHYAAQEAR